MEPSDEEVLAYSGAEAESADEDVDDDEQDADSGSEGAEAGAEDEDVGGWGSSKQDYYDADIIETEQDALDEEVEARRIQQKQLQNMTASDYGFDEDDWHDARSQVDIGGEEEERRVVTEVLPQLQVSKDMGPAERLKLLKSRYPEFEPLSKDFLQLQELAGGLIQEAKDAEVALSQQSSGDSDDLYPIAITKARAATAYLAALAMYFALLTSTADDAHSSGVALSASVIRDHPVMDSLLKCREIWSKVKDIEIEEITEDDMSSKENEPVSEEDRSGLNGSSEMPKQKSRKTKAQKAIEAAQAQAEARRAERMRRTEADLADLDDLVARKPTRAKTVKAKAVDQTVADGEDSDFGEETDLTAQELAEKAKRKKSLRFYTSQIAQKANKRGAAGRNAGGDDDVPHRERLRDRQARLNAEAEKRGKKQDAPGADLGGESDEDDRRQAQELRQGGDDNDYYDMVAARSSMKKSEKKALADAQRKAEEQGGRVIQKEEVGADGKRAISYLIEKNKGLTPHRKKDVRNPRVKKRKKYDEKKKKLASMKPVYKGGEGKGGYGGELTGIKTGLVRSRKL